MSDIFQFRTRTVVLALSAVSALTPPLVNAATDEYPPHRDSVVQPGVPKGELIKFEFAGSKIFPGTTREVTVYVPKQYDGSKPACVYVNQDGVQWNAPVVFDNLIAKGEIPVTIGVFVRPGVVKALDGNAALDRFNRSYEYDGGSISRAGSERAVRPRRTCRLNGWCFARRTTIRWATVRSAID
jgi:hypothetical protein